MSFLGPIIKGVTQQIFVNGVKTYWKEITGKTLEQKIAKLKELKASGEITEEEYKSLLRDEIGDI